MTHDSAASVARGRNPAKQQLKNELISICEKLTGIPNTLGGHTTRIGDGLRLHLFGINVDVLLTRKLNRPAVPVTIRGEQVFKGGCHFYLLEHRFTKIEATVLRKSFEEILPSWNCLGPIIDEGVYPLGSTGPLLRKNMSHLITKNICFVLVAPKWILNNLRPRVVMAQLDIVRS